MWEAQDQGPAELAPGEIPLPGLHKTAFALYLVERKGCGLFVFLEGLSSIMGVNSHDLI